MRPISYCLNKQLSEICQKTVQLEEISNKVLRLLPPNLAQQCKVGSFNKGCLVLTTTSSSWASQLRYALPELRDTLRKEAGLYQLSSVKIAVIEPLYTYKNPDHMVKHELSEQAKATLIKESQQCSYEPLQNALLNLASGTPTSNE